MANTLTPFGFAADFIVALENKKESSCYHELSRLVLSAGIPGGFLKVHDHSVFSKAKKAVAKKAAAKAKEKHCGQDQCPHLFPCFPKECIYSTNLQYSRYGGKCKPGSGIWRFEQYLFWI